MFKTLISLGVALCAATPALAQNDSAPVAGRMGEWTDPAPAGKNARSVVFVTAGTYADVTGARLFDVKIDADGDGDGENDVGVLRVTCNGGDTLSGMFDRRFTAATLPGASAKVTKGGAGPLAAGTSFKGLWQATSSNGSKTVALASSTPDICTGLG